MEGDRVPFCSSMGRGGGRLLVIPRAVRAYGREVCWGVWHLYVLLYVRFFLL